MSQHNTLWHTGTLFHVASRYPRKPSAPKVDRLANILRHGLLAPAQCSDGSVCSDLNLVMTGLSVPYEEIIFLHQLGPQSWLYIPGRPGTFAVFVDPTFPVLAREEMGAPWIVLCQDEVYVRDRIPPEQFKGIAVHRSDAESVWRELGSELQRLAIPLCDYEGNVVWSSERSAR